MQQQSNSIKVHNGILTGFKLKVSNIQELINYYKLDAKIIRQIKIMYSENLVSLDGIQHFKNLTLANFTGNSLKDLRNISCLSQLRQLNVSTNRIKSLKQISQCKKLIKINANHNLIENFQGFQGNLNALESIDLAGNKISDYIGLKLLGKLVSLKQLILEKKNATNPICNEKKRYIEALYESKILDKAQKIDGKNSYQFLKLKNQLSKNQSFNEISQENKNSNQNVSSNEAIIIEPYHKPKQHTTKVPQWANNRLRQLEDVINFKEEVIQQLKTKINNMEINNAQQYKQLIKKEVEFERVYTQLNQFSKQIENKQNKLSEAHKRLQQLLKTGASSNKIIQTKGEQIEQLRRQLSELKIQNAEAKALNSNYEKRMSQIQDKTYKNIQSTTLKLEQYRRKNEILSNENRQLFRDQDQYKNRIRQLTQLLRQYQLKVQFKQNQMQNLHENQKAQIAREWESKYYETAKLYEDQLKKMDTQMREQIDAIEAQYGHAIQQIKEKYKVLKKNYDQLTHQQVENRNTIKYYSQKNRQQQSLIQQMQAIMIRLKQDITQIMQEKQKMLNQLNNLKVNKNSHVKMLTDQVSKLNHQKNSLQKQVYDYRETIEGLNIQIERIQRSENEMADYQEKIQNLTAAVEAKNAMLQDKNDTIEQLKAQYDSLKTQEDRRNDEYNTLKKKYQRNKDKIKQIQQQTNKIVEENQTLQSQKQNWDQQKEELEKEFEDIKDILTKQSAEIEERDRKIAQIISILEQAKRTNIYQRQEIEQAKRQVERTNIQLNQKQKKWRREFNDAQNQWNQKKEQYQRQKQAYKANQAKFLRLAQQLGT